jgi:cobalt/nickel transport system permease protein
MHISEGVLCAPVLITGAALAAAGTAVGLRRLDDAHIAGAGLLAAAFFVASLIHIPLGPSSVHLILNGLVGLLLGWAAFPAILVALLLQAVFFQFGGLTSLGVNTLIMALPAVAAAGLLRRKVGRGRKWTLVAGFACGFLSVLGAGLVAALALASTEEAFLAVAGLLLAAHLPVMVIEGIVTAFCLIFLVKVKPELIPGLAGERNSPPAPIQPPIV